MTQDEQQLLQELANRIAQTPAPPRDPDAEDFIRRNIGSRPDALYLMTQTVLIQNMALQQAQQQIQALQRGSSGSAQIPGGPSSFLGQQQSRPSSYGSQYSAPPPSYAAPSPAAPAPQVSTPGGAPSFLRGAAQTAAGVAAGALAFEGIRSLFSHPGYGAGSGFFGGEGLGGGFGAPMEETVVNNYYDSPGDRQDFGSNDLQGNRDDFQAADDSANVDDSQYDDSGSIDDGGGFDDNSGGDSFI